MVQLLASYSVLPEVQQIRSGKEKLTPLLAGHLSYLEVEKLRGTRGQSDENRDGKNDLETCLCVTSLQSRLCCVCNASSSVFFSFSKEAGLGP